MTKLKEFNLALGVINNILVCDNRDNIVFAGDEIQKVLFPGKIYKKKLLDNFPEGPMREGLKKKLAAVREHKNTHQFSFDKKRKTIFLFPANYRQSHTILLSTREQLLLANKIENELKHRVKEMECLYDISNELEENKDLPKALERSLELLIKGFRYEKFTTAGIQIDGVFYGTRECEMPGQEVNVLSENIHINEKIRGKINVCYHKKMDFLPEETKLLKEIALMVSKAIEKKETREDLEKQRKLLFSQNRELKQLTENLSRSNTKLNALFNAITDSIVVVNKDFNITMSNKEEIGSSGKCYQKLFNSSHICDHCPAKIAFREARSVSGERKNNDQYFLLQAYPIMNNKGNVDKVIERCRNITTQKQIEEQLIQSYKLASLGKLTAGVAHEINNPNTFIRGNINIIDEAFKDILPILDKVYAEDPGLKIARLNYDLFRENVSILLEDMMGGANRIKKIVDGLRNFARKDEGLLTDAVDINYLVENHTRITQKEVRKHAQLKVKMGKDIPVFKGNIQKLEQVFLNLMINAAQAIEHHHGLIELETAYDKEKNKVIIRLSDNGKGIDDKTRKHIFDPFFTTKRDKGGTGLGLSISYGIIKEHNGRIEVESEVGKGTTFTIALPVVPPDVESL